jgi:hypothetical protein
MDTVQIGLASNDVIERFVLPETPTQVGMALSEAWEPTDHP